MQCQTFWRQCHVTLPGNARPVMIWGPNFHTICGIDLRKNITFLSVKNRRQRLDRHWLIRTNYLLTRIIKLKKFVKHQGHKPNTKIKHQNLPDSTSKTKVSPTLVFLFCPFSDSFLASSGPKTAGSIWRMLLRRSMVHQRLSCSCEIKK